MTDKKIIGRLEAICLPDLTIEQLHARVDTGAQTSSLHVDNVSQIETDGKPSVRFDIHPDIYNVEQVVTCEALIHDIRRVKSSNGVSEQRIVIQTQAKLGDITWPIEITLTDRSDMTYLMLIGREALKGRFLIDPDKTFIASDDK